MTTMWGVAIRVSPTPLLSTLQATLLTNAAMKVGFSGGLVVDFPHSTRAKKYFLVLMVGGFKVGSVRCWGLSAGSVLPRMCRGVQISHLLSPPNRPSQPQVGGHAAVPSAQGLDGEDPDEEGGQVRVAGRRTHRVKGSGKGKGRDWILKKKALRRSRGHEDVKPDTRYTGRKRKDRF